MTDYEDPTATMDTGRGVLIGPLAPSLPCLAPLPSDQGTQGMPGLLGGRPCHSCSFSAPGAPPGARSQEPGQHPACDGMSRSKPPPQPGEVPQEGEVGSTGSGPRGSGRSHCTHAATSCLGWGRLRLLGTSPGSSRQAWGWGAHLLGRGRHALLHHDEGPCDVLLLHPLAVHLDGLDAHLRLLWGQSTCQPTPSGPADPTLLCQSVLAPPRPAAYSGATVPQQGAACPYITWVLEGMQCPRPTGSLWKQGRGIWVCSGASGDLRPADP